MPYKTLIGELAKKKITKSILAKLLSIHVNSVTNKLNGNSSFTVEEAILIWKTYFPEWSIDDLFKKEG